MSGHMRNKVEPQMNGNITSGSIQNKMDNALDANNNYTCTTSRNDFLNTYITECTSFILIIFY